MLANQQKKKVEIAKIRVKLNVLKDDLETAVRERDFMKAQDLQMEIDEGDEKAPQDRKAEKKTPTASQIPKKTSPKKPLVPVKEEAALKKDAKRANNCKYACLLFSTIPYNGQV